MAEPIKQEFRAEGVDKFKRDLTDIADGTKEVGDDSREAGQKMGAFDGALGDITNQAKSLLGALVGGAGLIAAMQLFNAEMRENARIANDIARAQLDTLFLNQDYKPADLAAIDEAANITGQSRVVVGAARAQFISQTPSMNDEQRSALWRELVQTSLTTSSPMTAQVELFTKGSQFVSDPQLLQNLLRNAQKLSPEASPQALAGLLPQVLPFVNVDTLKLSPAELMGLATSAMSVAGSPDKGITALSGSLLKFGGGGTPEGRQMMADLGAPTELGVMGQLRALAAAKKAGTLDVSGLTSMFGEGNAAVVLSLLDNLPMVEENVADMARAGSSKSDLTEEAIIAQYGGSEQQRLRLQTEQSSARIEGMKSKDVNAQKTMLTRQLLEEEMIKRDYSPSAREIKLKAFDVAIFAGMSPEGAATFVAGFFSDLDNEVIKELEAGPEVGGGKRISGPPLSPSDQRLQDMFGRKGAAVYRDSQQPFGPPSSRVPVLDFSESSGEPGSSGAPGVSGAPGANVTIINYNNSFINGKDVALQDSGRTLQD